MTPCNDSHENKSSEPSGRTFAMLSGKNKLKIYKFITINFYHKTDEAGKRKFQKYKNYSFFFFFT